MAQFAQFDPAAESPAPVTGWYDASTLTYPNLPDASSLVEVSDAQWAMHFTDPNGWSVKDGRLIAPEND
jgi:hypothetical protein